MIARGSEMATKPIKTVRKPYKKADLIEVQDDDEKQLRPLLTGPVAVKVRAYAEKWGYPSSVVVNMILSQHFEKTE